VELTGNPDGPLVALAFKLEDRKFGQLTYLRIYEGVIRKGDSVINVTTGKKTKDRAITDLFEFFCSKDPVKEDPHMLSQQIKGLRILAGWTLKMSSRLEALDARLANLEWNGRICKKTLQKLKQSLLQEIIKMFRKRLDENVELPMFDGSGPVGGDDSSGNISISENIKLIPRLIRMHSNEMEDIEEAHAGQIVAVFGVDCASGDTFTDGSVKYTMTSMSVPEPVMSLAVQPISKDSGGQFSKALNRFQREDPTFRVGLDPESGQTIISGMGELHLDIYVERIRREYKVDVSVGKPRVNFRETVTQRADFDYLHKKQSGGQGQYGRVIGYIEPLPAGSETKFEFENMLVGQAVPSNFIPAIEKGFKEAANSGALIGHPVENLRVVLTDGAAHAVDSSELAFKMASIYAFRQCYAASRPVILEPVMLVELKVPTEFQGSVAGDLNKRKGVIVGNDQDGDDSVITAHVPLNNMFGYSTSLRSMTQGKGEFTMEYKEHSPVSRDVQTQLINTYKGNKPADE
ncbi:elongation factor G mitochondrial-like, partial [Trifolium pratense]